MQLKTCSLVYSAACLLACQQILIRHCLLILIFIGKLGSGRTLKLLQASGSSWAYLVFHWALWGLIGLVGPFFPNGPCALYIEL